MTTQIVEETAATELPSTRQDDAFTAPTREDESSTPSAPGLLMAGLVLVAALSAPISPSLVPMAAVTTPGRRESYSESVTEPSEADAQLAREVRDLFNRGASEFFEDGVHSNFSRSLLAMIAHQGSAAVRAIAQYLFSGSRKPSVVSEALRWIAEIQDPTTIPERWYVLQRSLESESPVIRDGAIVGFASLDDPHARPLLEHARQREHIAELRLLIDQVISQLAATENAAPAEKS